MQQTQPKPAHLQAEAIRRSGETNMFDMNTVQHYAVAIDAHELVVAIEEADNSGYIDLLQQARSHEYTPEQEETIEATAQQARDTAVTIEI